MGNPLKALYGKIMPKYDEPKQIGRLEYWCVCAKFFMNTSYSNFSQSYNAFFLTSALFAGMNYEAEIAPKLATLGVITILLGYVISPIIGMLVSRTNSRWGRYRPYGMFFMIPVVILNIMAFWCPGLISSKAIFSSDSVITGYAIEGLSATGAFVYHFARTILCNVFQSLYAQGDNIRFVITGNSEEKKNLLSLISILNSAAYAVPVIFVWLGSFAFSSLIKLYFAISVAICLLQFVTNVLCFKFTKERIPYNPEPVKFSTAMLQPFKYKPFLIYQISTWFNQFGISGLATTYLAAVVVGEENYVKFAVPTAVGTIVGLIVCNLLLKFGIQPVTMMRFVGVYCLAIGIILTIIGPFAGMLFYAFYFLFGMTFGFLNVLPTLIQSDVNDYLEYKTGQRIDASAGVFADYIKTGIREVLTKVIFVRYMLVWAGYKAAQYAGQTVFDANAANREKTAGTLMLYVAVVTGVGYFLASMCYWFYDLTGDKKKQMLEALKERREAIRNGTVAQADEVSSSDSL